MSEIKQEEFETYKINNETFKFYLSYVFPVPFDLWAYKVPHLKAPVCGYMEPRGLRCGKTLILCHALLKKTTSLHTDGLVKFHSHTTVHLVYFINNAVKKRLVVAYFK